MTDKGDYPELRSNMGRILVGVSSWADPELAQSSFYPPDVKTPEARLSYYASRFSVAEIDSSYHFFPTRRNLQLWLTNTPPGFVFDVKAFSLFTQHPTPFTALPKTIREKHGSQIQAKGNVYLRHLPEAAVEDLWEIFLRSIEPFQSERKLGAVLFQFPPWFHPEPGNFDHISGCRRRLSAYRVAVEFRVGSWLQEKLKDTLDFLRKLDIALVCVDEPQGFKSSVPPLAEVTSSLGFVRFHGRNADNWERKGVPTTEKFDYLYTEDELKEWVPKALSMAERSQELHVIFKNKHADYPVRNAAQMKEMIGLT